MQEQRVENPLEQVFLYNEQISRIEEQISVLKGEMKIL